MKLLTGKDLRRFIARLLAYVIVLGTVAVTPVKAHAESYTPIDNISLTVNDYKESYSVGATIPNYDATVSAAGINSEVTGWGRPSDSGSYEMLGEETSFKTGQYLWRVDVSANAGYMFNDLTIVNIKDKNGDEIPSDKIKIVKSDDNKTCTIYLLYDIKAPVIAPSYDTEPSSDEQTAPVARPVSPITEQERENLKNMGIWVPKPEPSINPVTGTLVSTNGAEISGDPAPILQAAGLSAETYSVDEKIEMPSPIDALTASPTLARELVNTVKADGSQKAAIYDVSVVAVNKNDESDVRQVSDLGGNSVLLDIPFDTDHNEIAAVLHDHNGKVGRMAVCNNDETLAKPNTFKIYRHKIRMRVTECSYFAVVFEPKKESEDKTENKTVKPVSVYRLFNAKTGEHFFTVNKSEKDGLLQSGWADEGIAFTAHSESDKPVYRLFNKETGEHRYVLSGNDIDKLTSLGFTKEGIAWYAGEESVILLTDNKAKTFKTHLTSNSAEKEALTAAGWTAEKLY